VIASNRIDTPEVAEAVLAEGAADMLSLARPFPADAHFVKKAAGGRAADLAPFDEIAVATGALPRGPAIPGADLPHVAGHAGILSGAVVAGARVAVLGAGGIGVDGAAFLVTGESAARDPVPWRREWGVADPARMRGGLAEPRPAPPLRQVTLLQRSPGRPGRGLGRTTG
jgi:2,4-dienoyl-CoA reductase (NADPH2)